jgi:hypothetical protein
MFSCDRNLGYLGSRWNKRQQPAFNSIVTSSGIPKRMTPKPITSNTANKISVGVMVNPPIKVLNMAFFCSTLVYHWLAEGSIRCYTHPEAHLFFCFRAGLWGNWPIKKDPKGSANPSGLLGYQPDG